MPAISEDDIRKIREANDLVELFSERTRVNRKGRDFWCCCPFHQEKTPSCKIDPSTQTWHCFGCGEGGDIFAYIMKMDDVGFLDAVRFLARRANIEIQESAAGARSQTKKARLRDVCREAAEFYHLILMREKSDGAQAAREYLGGRDLGGKVPKVWNLGFAPGSRRLVGHLSQKGFSAEEMIEANVAVKSQGSMLNDRFFNRVMFPINDVKGECIAFGGRVIGAGEPKYLNSGETPIFHKSEVLYGLDKAKSTMASSGVAVIVEGYTDVIALHEAGFTNAVATLGTSLTRQHIRILSHHAKSKIIYLFDGDEAGQRAADRALEFIDSSMTPEAGIMRIDLYAATIPGGMDPAEYVKDAGVEAMHEVLDSASPLLKYGIDRRLARYDLSRPEDKARAVSDAVSVLAPIKDSIMANEYAIYIASQAGLAEQLVLDQLAKVKPPRVYNEKPAGQGKWQGQGQGSGQGFGQGQSSSQGQGQGQGQAPGASPTQASQDAALQGASAPGHVQVQPRRELTISERNRLRSEREFLSLLAQNPAMAHDFLPTLMQTHWHENVHAQLANVLIDVLSANPTISVPDLLVAAQAKNKYASKVLTSSIVQGTSPAFDSLSYLAQGLSIGDREETLEEMTAQLKNSAHLSAEERDELFKTIVALQSDLNTMRSKHVDPKIS